MTFSRKLFGLTKTDATTSASHKSSNLSDCDKQGQDALLIVKSIHHQNTQKIACEIANVLNATVKHPEQFTIDDLKNPIIIGFGSGIYDQKHHSTILELVDKIPENSEINAFIFSTSGLPMKYLKKNSKDDPHKELRNKLENKKAHILDEYNCPGWNTNSFLKYFGGLNKGRPNQNDLKDARLFAERLKTKIKLTNKEPGKND